MIVKTNIEAALYAWIDDYTIKNRTLPTWEEVIKERQRLKEILQR